MILSPLHKMNNERFDIIDVEKESDNEYKIIRKNYNGKKYILWISKEEYELQKDDLVIEAI